MNSRLEMKPLSPIRHKRWGKRPFAALALVGIIGAGCGANAPSDTNRASASGSSSISSSPGGTTATTTARDKAVKFAECIREHGVADFPDANAKGEFVFGINVSPEVWTKAVDACKALQPAGTLSATRSPKQQSAGLKFGQCIRDNGVPDFPDPVQGEPLIDTERIPSANRKGGMGILNAAMKACRDLLDAAAEGQ
jgi:hypothetical protein